MASPSELRSRELVEQLASVREALLEDARREADLLVGVATSEAAKIVADAVASRNAAIEQSRADGLAAAEHHARLDAAEARRAVRSRILAAQRAAHDELREAVETAVAALRDDPGYGSLLDGWTEIALAQIGREATVVRDPVPDGGIIATLDDRRVTYTLTALAEHQVTRLADEVGALWT